MSKQYAVIIDGPFPKLKQTAAEILSDYVDPSSPAETEIFISPVQAPGKLRFQVGWLDFSKVPDHMLKAKKSLRTPRPRPMKTPKADQPETTEERPQIQGRAIGNGLVIPHPAYGRRSKRNKGRRL